MDTPLTNEQKKGNLLREWDGYVKLAKIDKELCVDVVSGRLGDQNGGDYNTARKDAKTIVAGIEMMANGVFGFDRAAKSAQAYFAPDDEQIAPQLAETST